MEATEVAPVEWTVLDFAEEFTVPRRFRRPYPPEFKE
jgi:hypothetical protein